jgi:hypothetical protein
MPSIFIKNERIKDKKMYLRPSAFSSKLYGIFKFTPAGRKILFYVKTNIPKTFLVRIKAIPTTETDTKIIKLSPY